MKQGLKAQGFTVVEVLIVLAVSVAILISGLMAISGQQHKTEFNQAVNDIKSQIDQVINNVATGYYVNDSNFTCSPIPQGPQPVAAAGSNLVGTHYGCILVGRAIQFGVLNGNGTQYNIFNLAGLQYVNGNTTTDVTSESQAKPQAIPNNIENKTLANGLMATNVRYNDTTNTSIVAIITDFAQASSSGLLPSSRTAQLWVVNSPFNTDDQGGAINKLNTAVTNNYYGPVNKVDICFQSGGTDQVGVITIGGSGRQLTTNLKIYANKAAANAAVTSGMDCP